jgi:Kef-type K+ transport system membrane component KefB
LLLVVFLAFLVPLALSRLKQLHLPIVVGEILAGIVVGSSGLGLVTGGDPILDLLSEFGFVFLMFLSGMEIDFSNFARMPDRNNGRLSSESKKAVESGWGPLQLGLATFLLTLLLSSLVGWVMVLFGLARNPWMLALILSTTSLGVVLPVLKERGLSSGRYGQSLLVSALIADFATMLLITILVAIISHGLTLDILLVGMLFVAFFLIYRFGVFFFQKGSSVRRAMEDLSHATAQIKVRAAFTMMLIFVVLSEFLGTEIILGAFLAGAIISLLRRPEDAELSNQLDAIGFGFFIPIFFIMVGVNFNLHALLSSSQGLLLIPVLLLAAFLVKFLPGLLYRFSFSWREAFGAGSLLSSRLSLIIAASAIGLRLDIISESTNAAIILVAILSVTLSPFFFLRLLPKKAGGVSRPILVVGAGELGVEVAKGLAAHNESVVLVDEDLQRVERALQHGYRAIQDRAEDPGPELASILDEAQGLICTYNDAQRNYQICLQARTVFGLDHIVAQVSTPGALPQFEQLGVATMNAALDRSALLVLLARNPALYELLTRTDDDKEVAEVVVNNPACHGRSLGQLGLPGDVLVLALRRDGDLLVPHGNTQVQPGDHLTLVGSLGCIEEARDVFNANRMG